MDNKKEDKSKKAIEKLEKAAGAMDKGVDWTEEKLSTVPSMLGAHRSKIIVGLVVLFVLALVRDPSLALIGVVIAVILFASQILKAVKDSMNKKPEVKKAEETKEE